MRAFSSALVLISGALKYYVNVYAGVVAERMLRRLRYQLYSHLLRFPLPHLRRVSQGELVQMINAETEALGGFVGEAVSTPGLQAGTLLTSLFFMFMQDWKLGPGGGRPLPAAGVADPQAAAPGQPSGQGAGAPGPAQRREDQRGHGRRPRHPCQ